MFASPRCGYTGSAVGWDHPSARDRAVGPAVAEGNGSCPVRGVFGGTGGFEHEESATKIAIVTSNARRPDTFPTVSNRFGFTWPPRVRSIGRRLPTRRTR